MAAPRTTTIIFDHEFNPNYDIVWSLQFLLSGNQNSSAAFTTFLSDSTSLTTPGTGIDVGYSGEIGLSGAKICAGFDTTGLFAQPFTYPDLSTRDGTTPQPNMLVVRGGYPNFSLLFAAPLSALSDTFNLLSFTETYQTLRFRLGNIGRTLHIDWRPDPSSSYQQLTSVDTNLSINDNDTYYVGFSFSTPVSTTAGWEEADLYLKQLIYQGSNTEPTYSSNSFEPVFINLCNDCLVPTVYYTVSAEIPPVPVYFPINTYIVYVTCSQVDPFVLYSERGDTLQVGPLYIDETLTLPYTGEFVYFGDIYNVVNGNVTLLQKCPGPLEPYEPEIPVLFRPTITFNEQTTLDELFS